MDNLLISIRNDLLKICDEIYTINGCTNNRIKENIQKNIDDFEDNISKNIENLEDNVEINKSEENILEKNTLVKTKKKRKEVPLEERCIKIIKKNNKDVRCSFRKIEEKDFCKKHLKD